MSGSDTLSDDDVSRQNLRLDVRHVQLHDERHQAPPLNIFTAAAPAQSAQPAHTHTSSPDVPDKSLACGVCENCCSMLPGPACHRLQAQMVAAALPHPGALLTLQGANGIGTKIRCWWSADATFYSGVITGFRAKDMAHTITYEDGNVERRQLWDHRIELQLEAGDGTARSAAQKRKTTSGEQLDAILCGGSDSQEAYTAGGAAAALRSFRSRPRKAPANKVRSSAPTIFTVEPASQIEEEPICISSDEDEEGSESPPLLVPMKIEQAEAGAGHLQLGFRAKAAEGQPSKEATSQSAVKLVGPSTDKPASLSTANHVSKPVAHSTENLAGFSREETIDLSEVDPVHPSTVDLEDSSTREPAHSSSVDHADPLAEERADPSAEEHADLHEEDPGELVDPTTEEEPAGRSNDGVSLVSSSRKMRSRGSDAAGPAQFSTCIHVGRKAHSKMQRDQRMQRRQQMHGGWEPLPRQLIQQQQEQGEPEEQQQQQQQPRGALEKLHAQPGTGPETQGGLAAVAGQKHKKFEGRGGSARGRGGRRGHQADNNGASLHRDLSAKASSQKRCAWPVISSPSKTLAEGTAHPSWASDFAGVILGHRVHGLSLAAHVSAPAAVVLAGDSGAAELQDRSTTCDGGSEASGGQRHVRQNSMLPNPSALLQTNLLQQPQPASPGLSKSAATVTTARLSSKGTEAQPTSQPLSVPLAKVQPAEIRFPPWTEARKIVSANRDCSFPGAQPPDNLYKAVAGQPRQVQIESRSTMSPEVRGMGDTSIAAATTSREVEMGNKGASIFAVWQAPHLGTQSMLQDGSVMNGQQHRTSGGLHQLHARPAINRLDLSGAPTAECMDKIRDGSNGDASRSGQTGGHGMKLASGNLNRVAFTNAPDNIMSSRPAVLSQSRAAAEGGGQRSRATDDARASLELVGKSLQAAEDPDTAAVSLERLFGTTSKAGDGVTNGEATAAGTRHGQVLVPLPLNKICLLLSSVQQLQAQSELETAPHPPANGPQAAPAQQSSLASTLNHSGIQPHQTSKFHNCNPSVAQMALHVRYADQHISTLPQDASRNAQGSSTQVQLHSIQPTLQSVVLLPELDYSKTLNELLASIGPALRLMTRRLGSSSEKQLAVTEAIVAMDASQRHDLVYLRYAFLKAEFEDGNNDMLRERMRRTFGVDV